MPRERALRGPRSLGVIGSDHAPQIPPAPIAASAWGKTLELPRAAEWSPCRASESAAPQPAPHCSWSCLIDGSVLTQIRPAPRSIGVPTGSRPKRTAHDGGAGPSGMDGGAIQTWARSIYLDTLRGDAATRPIWALSRSLVGVVDEPCSMASNFRRAGGDLQTRAGPLYAGPAKVPGLHVMARALARGGVFLKGKRAGTLVASLIKHTTHSPPERLGLVPLLICDETVEVLLPLLRCTDWIDFDDGILWYFRSLY